MERVLVYYRKYGLKEVSTKVLNSPRKAYYGGRRVYFSLACACLGDGKDELYRADLVLDTKDKMDALSQIDINLIAQLRGERITRRLFTMRFAKGARIHLLRDRGEIVSTCWTIEGDSIQGLPFRILRKEAHLFEGETMPSKKGRGYAPSMVKMVVRDGCRQGIENYFTDIEPWNKPAKGFIRKTPFEQIETTGLV